MTRRRGRAVAAAGLVLALAGCSPGSSPGPSASALPSPVGSAAASPSSTAAAGGGVSATIVGTGPVIPSTAGPSSHSYALPAAFAQAPDGSYVLFVVWFGAAAGDQLVTVSTSVDGHTWSIGTSAIYTDLGLGFRPPGPVPSSALVLDDGTWVLYGWGATASDPGFVTWRATAPKPTGPWTADPGVVLGAGPAGSWDSGTAAAGTVFELPDGLAMWYDGDPGGGGIQGDIGYATSSDGRMWQRVGEPVLSPGACGPRTSGAVVQPQVWATDDGFLMLFAALQSGIGISPVYAASSADGRRWQCLSTEPLLEASDIPGSQGLHRIHGATIGGREMLFVESLASGRSDIWLASIQRLP